jgi:hypothetical protein
MQEIRQSIDTELQTTQSLVSEIIKLCQADDKQEDLPGTATFARADDMQQQVVRAKERLLQAEKLLKSIDARTAQLKGALRVESEKK